MNDTIANLINTIASTLSKEEKKAVYNALGKELYPNPRIKGINLYLASEGGKTLVEALRAKAEENANAYGMAFVTSGNVYEMLMGDDSSSYALALGDFDCNLWGTQEYVRGYGKEKGYQFETYRPLDERVAVAPFNSIHYPNGYIAWATSLTLLLAFVGVLKRLPLESDGLRCYAVC